MEDQEAWERWIQERLDDLEARRARASNMRPGEARDQVLRRLEEDADAVIEECRARVRRLMT